MENVQRLGKGREGKCKEDTVSDIRDNINKGPEAQVKPVAIFHVTRISDKTVPPHTHFYFLEKWKIS